MRRDDYLGDERVQAFIKWLRRRVGGDESFEHSYRMVRPACDWHCGSLWEAYTNYRWKDRDFKANQEELNGLRGEMLAAVEGDDSSRFVDAACGILRWGGVTRGNVKTLRDLGPEALSRFRGAACLLDPSHADTSRLGRVRYMNSGWTKVYALMLEGFPIYDSRVGAAMGYLVQRYCKEVNLSSVPELLLFRLPPGRAGRVKKHNRNPSEGSLQFPQLYYSGRGRRRWAECNVWAAWVLGEVACEGSFAKLAANRRLRALEAALFMIGYTLPGPP